MSHCHVGWACTKGRVRRLLDGTENGREGTRLEALDVSDFRRVYMAMCFSWHLNHSTSEGWISNQYRIILSVPAFTRLSFSAVDKRMVSDYIVL